MATMEGCVALVNKLQALSNKYGGNVGRELWDLLPAIIVIGGQSSGKSSVLESIIGLEDGAILPRGTGIVTKAPIVVQLVRNGEGGTPPYGIFAHDHDRRYRLDVIQAEIMHRTRVLTEKSTVSSTPIMLTLYAPDVVNLTLVDLPGMTRVSLDGQQPQIVDDLNDLIFSFASSNSRALLLAVSPANADISTSDALSMARRIDPTGSNTIGVLTKIDLMDRGTDCRDILQNESVNLVNGWFGVVGRSHSDLVAGVSLRDHRNKENAWFAEHASYRDLPNVTTAKLTDYLTQILELKIMQEIPSIRRALLEGIEETQAEYVALLGGQPDVIIAFPDTTCCAAMVHAIENCCRLLEKTFSEIIESGQTDPATMECHFSRIFRVTLVKAMDRCTADVLPQLYSPDTLRKLSVEEAERLGHHLRGGGGGGVGGVGGVVVVGGGGEFCSLLSHGFEVILPLVLDCVERVHHMLTSMFDRAVACTTILHRYPMLREEVSKTGNRALETYHLQAQELVRTRVDIERSSFVRSRDNKHFPREEPSADAWTTISVELRGYFEGVMSTLVECVPKICVYAQILPAKGECGATTTKKAKMTKDHVAFSFSLPSSSSLLGSVGTGGVLRELLESIPSRDDEQLRGMLAQDEHIARKRDELLRRLELFKEAVRELDATTTTTTK